MRVPANTPHGRPPDGETANEKQAAREPIDLVAAYQVQAIHQAHARCAGQYKSEPVKGALLAGAGIGNKPMGKDHAQEPERDIQEEDPTPRSVGCDETADGRAQYWCCQPRPSDIGNRAQKDPAFPWCAPPRAAPPAPSWPLRVPEGP